jgi:hypothetical protein
MAAIYSNGGNRWNILGFNFTKRDVLSSVCKISMGGMDVFWNDPLLKAVAKKLFYITTLQNVIIYFSTIISSILIIIYKHYHRRNVKNEFSFNGCFLLVESLI